MRWPMPRGRRSCRISARPAASVAENKAADGFDPVTEADRAAERGDARHPGRAPARRTGSWARNSGPQPGTSGLTWVLDPIDGTRGFISRHADLGRA